MTGETSISYGTRRFQKRQKTLTRVLPRLNQQSWTKGIRAEQNPSINIGLEPAELQAVKETQNREGS